MGEERKQEVKDKWRGGKAREEGREGESAKTKDCMKEERKREVKD